VVGQGLALRRRVAGRWASRTVTVSWPVSRLRRLESANRPRCPSAPSAARTGPPASSVWSRATIALCQPERIGLSELERDLLQAAACPRRCAAARRPRAAARRQARATGPRPVPRSPPGSACGSDRAQAHLAVLEAEGDARPLQVEGHGARRAAFEQHPARQQLAAVRARDLELAARVERPGQEAVLVHLDLERARGRRRGESASACGASSREPRNSGSVTLIRNTKIRPTKRIVPIPPTLIRPAPRARPRGRCDASRACGGSGRGVARSSLSSQAGVGLRPSDAAADVGLRRPTSATRRRASAAGRRGRRISGSIQPRSP